jgi:hypothetical protein
MKECNKGVYTMHGLCTMQREGGMCIIKRERERIVHYVKHCCFTTRRVIKLQKDFTGF